MAKAITDQNCQIIAVDNSEAMIKRCKEKINKALITSPVKIICQDIRDTNIENAKIVLLNFTLQFIEHDKRTELLKKIYNGLVKNGILILSEKITFNKQSDIEFNESLLVEFKKANGYSDLEISQKRTALEKVLVPDTIKQHQERLKQCGFSDSKIWYRCLNFASMIAFK
jgi:tRNA (cmo5U34)-methyltransferase